MKILILGGTRFLGRFLAETALRNGHEVTLFNRGKSDPELFPEAEKLIGDRDGNLEALTGRSWDTVIDTSGFTPWTVHDSAQLLAGAAGHYTFISSASVYEELEKPGTDEDHPVGTLSPEQLGQLKEMEAAEAIGLHYGALKYLCEEEVARAFPGSSLIVRPGLIVGPYDVTDRFGYWVNRIAAGGEVLAPGRPDKEVQFIDVRDLAEWILRMVEANVTGTFNAVGPEEPLTMEEFLHACSEALRSSAEFVWADEQFLLEHEVSAWSDMPLWIPDSYNMAGFLTVDSRKALEHGLTFRPLDWTVRDVYSWEKSRPEGERKAGLGREKEQAVLAAWKEK